MESVRLPARPTSSSSGPREPAAQPALKGRGPPPSRRLRRAVVDALAYFMADGARILWVRRTSPDARIVPSQKSVDALTGGCGSRWLPSLQGQSPFVRLCPIRQTGIPSSSSKKTSSARRDTSTEYLSLRQTRDGGKARVRSAHRDGIASKDAACQEPDLQLLALVYPPGDIAAAE